MILIGIYLAAVVAANVLVSVLGPAYAPLIALVFIGMDLALRDRLHDRWGARMPRNMALLIVAGCAASLVVNANVARVAVASAAAFAGGESVKTVAYSAFRRWSRLPRLVAANLPAALVDSILFLTLAFGHWMPGLVALQFVAKAAGAMAWGALFRSVRAPQGA